MPTKPFAFTSISPEYANLLARKLTELGVTFQRQDVLKGFWMVDFTIDKPMGKGAMKKRNEVYRLCDPLTKLD